MKKHIYQLSLIVAMVGLFSGAAQADAVLSGLDHTFQISGNTSLVLEKGATALISLPNGDTILAESQDQIPADLSDAVIDIFSGCASANGQNQVSLCVGNSQGKAVAVGGSVTLTTDVGKSLVLNEGDEYYIAFEGEYVLEEEELAPPTAASGEFLGNPADGFDGSDPTNFNDDGGPPPSP